MGARAGAESLPPALRHALDTAIAGGATTDEIAERIRCSGGGIGPAFRPESDPRNGPRSGPGIDRVAAPDSGRARALVERQREADDIAAIWVRELGDRPEGRTGHFAIETLRTLALHSAAAIGERDEPAAPEEIARLALALSRIESAGRLSAERERAIARAAAAESEAKAAARAGKAARKAGLSAHTVTAIRCAIQGSDTA